MSGDWWQNVERRKLVAEVLGTFVLVFAGTGAVVVNDVTGGAVSHVGIALVFGLVVMALVYTVGDVSGAHLNPAVSIGFWVSRRFPGGSVLPYVASQFLGALLASILLQILFPENLYPDHPTKLGTTLPAGPPLQSFVLEIVLTAMLMWVILCVSTGAKEKGLMAGVAVGGVIALEALFAGPITGASMNPARSLAPALVSGNVQHLWVYLLAPVLGGLLGVVGCNYVSESKGEGASTVKKKVLFVCVHNSNRSQMAEALARLEGGGNIEAYSAGSAPSGVVNPKAISALQELGYDLSKHTSKKLGDVPDIEYDAVVTMGCGDSCANVRAKQKLDWQIPDPKDLPPDEFRQIRDLIRGKVKELVGSL